MDALEPLTDITETPNEYIITIDLPFIEDKNQIEIYVQGNALEISAEMRKAVRYRHAYSYGEAREVRRFTKRITLPFEINEDEISASFKNGVLVVRVQKPKEKRTKIKVQ